MRIGTTVNGTAQDHEVEPRTLLVQYLREACGLTGTKIGCDTSSCGACTVLLDGESVKSCTMLAAQADGAAITTIEGLAQGEKWHPVQTAFHENHGLQCGYCTAGMVLRGGVVARRDTEPDRAGRAARPRRQPLPLHRIPQHREVGPRRGRDDAGRQVIPAAFDYVRAGSAAEAISLIGEHGEDAKFLAGGMSLLPLMKLRLATPSVLVDVGRVRDLSYVRDAGDHLAIGALTRHRDLETNDLLAKECGVLRAVAAQVGDNQVRHRGTIGGSVAHGDPASDLPAALLALDATFVLQGPGGSRSVGANDFFKGFLETALAPDELLTEIQVRKSGAAGFAYEKFNRRAQDWAIVGALAARVNGGTHVALVNMGATILRARAVENALAQGASAADAAREAAIGTDPPSDLNASPEYRTHLAQVLVRRALEAI